LPPLDAAQTSSPLSLDAAAKTPLEDATPGEPPPARGIGLLKTSFSLYHLSLYDLSPSQKIQQLQTAQLTDTTRWAFFGN
jgi:hypothetical protein